LDLRELHARLPHVPTLEAVLAAARDFNQAADPLRGIVIIELKAAAPLCDLHDTQERVIVSKVTHVIRHLRMTQQVLLTSFSPTLLYLAHRHAPEIERILAVSGLQFLSEEQIEAALGLPVTRIDKRLSLGLEWAELGPVFRLPGYRSLTELLQTAALTGASVVEADLLLLHSAGAPLVEGMHAAGLKVFGFTANSESDWDVLEALGVDGIYTNDVSMGVRRQPTIP
jgi:glycerophosphoryl diester phosphodiesterase